MCLRNEWVGVNVCMSREKRFPARVTGFPMKAETARRPDLEMCPAQTQLCLCTERLWRPARP